MADPDFVHLLTARSRMEALLVLGILESEGVLARAPGMILTDDWAASQQLMRTVGLDIMVAQQDADRARAILDEHRAAAAGLQETDDPEPADPGE